MILQAAKEFDIDLSQSVLVGDKDSDIQAGIAAGVGRNLLYRPSSSNLQGGDNPGAVATIGKLMDAIPYIT